MRQRHITDIDLNLLVAFDALYRDRSVSLAARRLGITQSGMSRVLERLREQMGDGLFVRTRAGLVPTPRGEEMAAHVEEVLGIVQSRLLAQEEFDPKHAERTFVIATADYCEVVFLAPLARRLAIEAPRVRIRSVPTLADDVARLQAGDVDLTLALRPPEAGGIRIQHAGTEVFVCIVRKRHPALHRGRIALEDWLALDHVVAAPHGRPGSPIDDILLRTNKTRNTRVMVQSFLAAGVLVAASDMVATLPATIAHDAATRNALTVVPPPVDFGGFDLVTAWFERTQHDSGHRWMRRTLQETVAGVVRRARPQG